MNSDDQQQLIDYWHKNTCHLNEQIDDAFKLAQDQAYKLGLKRGRKTAVLEAIQVIDKRVVANEHIPIIYLREYFKTELESV